MILDKIQQIWSQHPELRFNQLIYILQAEYSQTNDGYGSVKNQYTESVAYDFFYLSDKKFEMYLTEKLEKITEFKNKRASNNDNN